MSPRPLLPEPVEHPLPDLAHLIEVMVAAYGEAEVFAAFDAWASSPRTVAPRGRKRR